jgi:hypothetical protein
VNTQFAAAPLFILDFLIMLNRFFINTARGRGRKQFYLDPLVRHIFKQIHGQIHAGRNFRLKIRAKR